MSTDAEDPDLNAAGVPELTPLGKRIEMLRLERRMSKRVLAQRAGTSRQQLWRVMTGKSDLTSSLCARLSEVLETDSRLLREPLPPEGRNSGTEQRHLVLRNLAREEGHAEPAESRLCQTLEEYLSSPDGLERTLDTLPLTDDGRMLKRALLDAIEDIAMARSLKLPDSIFELRRAIVNDTSDAAPALEPAAAHPVPNSA